MKIETEMTLRTLLASDPSVAQECVQRAICLLRGDRPAKPAGEIPSVVMRHKDVMAFLGITKRSLTYLLNKGYMERVYASPSSKHAIGVARDSVYKFKERKLERRVS